MPDTPELYWRVNVDGNMKFKTAAEIAQLGGRIEGIVNMTRENAYVNTAYQSFQSFRDWQRNKRC